MEPALSCDAARQAVHWFLDDDVEPELYLNLERHLQQCTECRVYLQREARVREAVRSAGSEVRCPTALRRRVGGIMDAERRSGGPWVRLAPAVAVAMAVMAFVWHGASTAEAVELEEVARRHSRDLPMDVVAADVSQLGLVQHYFDGKLPFAVRLPTVQQVAVQRLGGRITSLGHRDAAYVRFELPRGRMSMFVYEDDGDGSALEVEPLYRVGQHRVMLRRVRGYTVAQWRADGLVYSMVSDLPEQELSSMLTASFVK